MAFKMKGFTPHGNSPMTKMGRGHESVINAKSPMTLKKSAYKKGKDHFADAEEKVLDKGGDLDIGAGLKAGKGFTDRLKNRGVKSAVRQSAPARYARTVTKTLGPEYAKAAKGAKGYLSKLAKKAKEKVKSAMTMKKGKGAMKKLTDLTGDGKVTRADVLKGRGVKLKK